jgi:hypothetical protein
MKRVRRNQKYDMFCVIGFRLQSHFSKADTDRIKSPTTGGSDCQREIQPIMRLFLFVEKGIFSRRTVFDAAAQGSAISRGTHHAPRYARKKGSGRRPEPFFTTRWRGVQLGRE